MGDGAVRLVYSRMGHGGVQWLAFMVDVGHACTETKTTAIVLCPGEGDQVLNNVSCDIL